MPNPPSSDTKLTAAWKKFQRRLNEVRAKSKQLMTTADKADTDRELAELQKRIRES